jgi:hypothetical protein
MEVCHREEPGLVETGPGQQVRCHMYLPEYRNGAME